MTAHALFRVIGFQVVWFACAIGASQGRSWPGITAAALLCGWQVAASPRRNGLILAIAASAVMGFTAESVLVAAGLVKYTSPWPAANLAPAWVVALWAAFSVTLEPLQAALGRHRFAKAALLGAVSGPVSYIAGARMGALVFPNPFWPSLCATAVIWGLALPLLLMVHSRVIAARPNV